MLERAHPGIDGGGESPGGDQAIERGDALSARPAAHRPGESGLIGGLIGERLGGLLGGGRRRAPHRVDRLGDILAAADARPQPVPSAVHGRQDRQAGTAQVQSRPAGPGAQQAAGRQPSRFESRKRTVRLQGGNERRRQGRFQS